MEQVAAVVRLTIGFFASVVAQLEEIHVRTGMSKTDIANRAVSLYAYVDKRIAAGDTLMIRSGATGEIERITLL